MLTTLHQIYFVWDNYQFSGSHAKIWSLLLLDIKQSG